VSLFAGVGMGLNIDLERGRLPDRRLLDLANAFMAGAHLIGSHVVATIRIVSNDKTKDETFRVRMTAYERRLLEELAATSGVSASDVVRGLVSERWQKTEECASRRRMLADAARKVGDREALRIAERWKGVAPIRLVLLSGGSSSVLAVAQRIANERARAQQYAFDVGTAGVVVEKRVARRLAAELRPLRDSGFPITLPVEFAPRGKA
jgi:hypothetical protein